MLSRSPSNRHYSGKLTSRNLLNIICHRPSLFSLLNLISKSDFQETKRATYWKIGRRWLMLFFWLFCCRGCSENQRTGRQRGPRAEEQPGKADLRGWPRHEQEQPRISCCLLVPRRESLGLVRPDGLGQRRDGHRAARGSTDQHATHRACWPVPCRQVHLRAVLREVWHRHCSYYRW